MDRVQPEAGRLGRQGGRPIRAASRPSRPRGLRLMRQGYPSLNWRRYGYDWIETGVAPDKAEYDEYTCAARLGASRLGRESDAREGTQGDGLPVQQGSARRV